MRIIRSFLIALSMYSKIPVPRCEWKEEDMRYIFIFFPLIGIVTGGLIYAWNYLCISFEFSDIFRVCITAAIPIAITGGIHIDGFMDTMDALHSYRDREKKLEILKDPHIGAFSVIMLIFYELLYIGFFSTLHDTDAILVCCVTFVLSRCLSGLCAANFKSAREGTLNTFFENSSKATVSIVLIIEALVCFVAMGLVNVFLAVGTLITALFTVFYYYLKTKKEFGGVTGDTAGYFLVILEGSTLIAISIISTVLKLTVK